MESSWVQQYDERNLPLSPPLPLPLPHPWRRMFNKEPKQGWRFAADAARITDEKVGSEDRKHASGGVLLQ